MSNIKERKQLLVVELKDWTILHSEKTIEELASKMSETDSNYIFIDWVLFNKYEFKKAYEKKADDITMFKLSLSPEDQNRIKEREKKMKELWKHRKNIEQIQRYLESTI